MPTPLYKSLKTNGTSIYAFPGAEEDINQQGENYKMYFSKFALIDLPKVQTALDDEPQYWDFDSAFYSASEQAGNNFSERIVNSLRNYVANHETTIKASKKSETEFFYDNSVLQTNTEKIFFKWLKKLNLIQFEAAVNQDEYFGNLQEFESNDPNDNEYFPEYLWKEREVTQDSFSSFYESPSSSNKLEIEYTGSINYKVGDWIDFTDVSNVNFPSISKYAQVLSVTEPTGSNGYKVVFDVTYTGSVQTEEDGYSSLVYNKCVKYIGEIQGNNNVVSRNMSFDQIMAFIPDTAGQTPDILFRTRFDNNYTSDLQFPILPSQFQPEILGAENFSNPLVQNPSNYPGDQYAQYDNDDSNNEYTYLTKSGDILRRSGDYFGVTGDINNTSLNGANIDGVQIDFDTSHYVKMNIAGQEVSNFDEFNSMKINGEFPSDFTYNAILWYYTVEDINGNSATNLYGISFIDNPANDVENPGTKFPSVQKLVATDTQDGTAFQYSLNKHTTLSTEQPQPTFTNDYINNLFGFNLFNEVMKRLVVFNDSALNIISQNKVLQQEISNIKGLLYTQTSIDTIKNQINQLNTLLNLYSTNQIVSTDSIKVEKDNSSSPPQIKLYNIEGRFKEIFHIETLDLYDGDGYIPTSINVPEGKDFMVKITNNDNVSQILPNNQKLTIYLNRDLDYKQSAVFYVTGTTNSTENKLLDILITYKNGTTVPVLTNAVTSMNLPVFFNLDQQETNKAYNWEQIRQDVTQFKLNNDGETVGMSCSRTTGLLKGDTIYLQNIYFGTDNIEMDGQYKIDDLTSDTINFDYTENSNLNDYITQEIIDGNISNGDILTDYNSMGSYRFNKGYIITITRIGESETSSFENRYLIDIKNVE
jgi:hypothetical protein